MSCSSSLRSEIYKEVFDENSAPSEEEVINYAVKIGINPTTESHLLHLARDGVMHAVPEGWQICYHDDAKSFYYFNTKTNQSQWDHPMDDIYRDLVKKVRTESISSTGEEDSKTSAKEDLKSFEEVTIPSEMMPKPLEALKPLGGGIKRSSLQLAPLRKPASPYTSNLDSNESNKPVDIKKLSLPFKRDAESPRPPIDLSLKRSTSNNEMGMRSISSVDRGSYESLPARSPSRIDIDIVSSKTDVMKKKDSLSPLQEKHPRSLYGHGELTLKGGGSMFLKSKQKKSDDSSLNLDGDSEVKSVEVVTSDSKDIPKGILREPVVTKQLWDIDPRDMSTEEKQLWRKQELEDERKSVRFNLEKDLKIKFNVSDSEENEEPEEDWNSEEQDTDEERIIAGIKVSDILNKMDLSEVDSDIIEPNIDETETQIGKIYEAQSEKDKNTQSLTDKLKALNLVESKVSGDLENSKENSSAKLGPVTIPADMFGHFMSPKLSEDNVSFLKNIKLKTPQEIKEMTSSAKSEKEIVKESSGLVKDVTKIIEKRQLGSSLFRNDIISKSVENIVLNGDLDKSSLEFDLSNQGNLAMFDNNSDVEKSIEERQCKLEQRLKDIEVESDLRIKKLREQLQEDERIERNRLTIQLEKQMTDFETNLRKQQESREQTAKENTEMLLNQLKAVLETENTAKMQGLHSEFEAVFTKEKKRLELECKEKLDALKVDIAEIIKRIEAEQIAGKHEVIDELRKKNRDELEEIKSKLSKEIDEKRAELVKRHSEDLVGLGELSTDEQSLKLFDLKKSVSRKIEEHENMIETLTASQTAELEKLQADHEEKIQALRSANEIHLEALKVEHQIEEENLKQTQADAMTKMKSDHDSQADVARVDYDRKEAVFHSEQEDLVLKVRSEHAMRLETVKNECLKEEEVIRREHLERLNELKARLDSERQRLRSHSDEKDPSGLVFEKLRCEKRLLEDKYRTLKDKYVRLKGDVKMSVERRRKREANATGSETERSTSHKTTDRSAVSDSLHAPKNDNDKQHRKRTPDNNNGAGNKTATSPKNLLSRLPSEEVLQGVDSDNVSSSSSKIPVKPVEHPRKRRQLFGRLKSASTSHIDNRSRRRQDDVDDSEDCSPVENLRRQLKKLDELEDQFPPATHADTYLRYPFSDPGQCGSSELEFFRHRIHLERDSVRRAKEFLQVQRGSFRSRQRELRRRAADGSTTARAMLDQLGDEERELTDMEVSLHRTRGLLGEKIIRLRHLEQSLHRASTPKVAGDEAATLSDISSHSGGSSGFSSIELPTDPLIGMSTIQNTGKRSAGHSYQEPTEIIRSLENLNTEIHDIWEVLNKSRPTIIPPPPFVYLPPTRLPLHAYQQQYTPSAIQYGNPVDPNLIERTKTLRDWLRQARIDSAELTSPGQATL